MDYSLMKKKLKFYYRQIEKLFPEAANRKRVLLAELVIWND